MVYKSPLVYSVLIVQRPLDRDLIEGRDRSCIVGRAYEPATSFCSPNTLEFEPNRRKWKTR